MKTLTILLQTILLVSIAISVSLSSPVNSQRSAPVVVGEVAPDFTLEDQNKNKVTLADARGKAPVIMVFYRGYW